MGLRKILICDDEPHILHVVATKLKNGGFDVLTAADGQEGLELALAESPDMIFTDYQMPMLSGLELCTQLRGHASTNQIPVVMLTARGFSMSDEDLSRLSIRRVLPKPFSPREVLAIAKEILEPAVVS